MSAWTREELLSLLADWKAAYKAASHGKSYTIGSRTLTRYDLSEIRDQIDWIGSELAMLSRGRGPVRVSARVVR